MLMVVLDDTGNVMTQFLGTEPVSKMPLNMRSAIQVAPAATVRESLSLRKEATSAKMEKISAACLCIRAQATRDQGGITKYQFDQKRCFRASASNGIIQCSKIGVYNSNVQYSALIRLYAKTLGVSNKLPRPKKRDEHASASALLIVSRSGESAFPNASVTINAPSWIHMPEASTTTCVGHETIKPNGLEFFFYARKPIPAATMRAKAIAKCRSTESQIKFASVSLRLPLALNCRKQSLPQSQSQSQKAAFKITLDTDKKVEMFDLFADMLVQAEIEARILTPAAKQAVTFEFHFLTEDLLPTRVVYGSQIAKSSPKDQATGTLIVSRHTNRYRIQSTSLPALWLLTSELCTRLQRRWYDSGGVQISYKEPLPLSDYFASVDDHHATRVALRIAESTLNDASHQFRTIEKRLLIRFKDGRPAQIHHLSLLMRQTHHNLQRLASIIQHAQLERTRSASILACSTNLLVSMMHFCFGLSAKKIANISSHINPDVISLNLAAREDGLAGWEEVADMSLAFLLKNVIMRRKFNGTPIKPAFPSTTDKLKKRIAIICDKLKPVN